jgi:hypothetical protein
VHSSSRLLGTLKRLWRNREIVCLNKHGDALDKNTSSDLLLTENPGCSHSTIVGGGGMYDRGGRGRETRGEGTEEVGTQEEAVGEGEGDGGSSCVGLSSSFHRELRLGKQEGRGLFQPSLLFLPGTYQAWFKTDGLNVWHDDVEGLSPCWDHAEGWSHIPGSLEVSPFDSPDGPSNLRRVIGTQ